MFSQTRTVALSSHPIVHPAGGHTTLFLVRHGRTIGNVQRLLCGWTDVPLDELGIKQADLVGDRLANSITADVLLASPLQRARVTAGAIGGRMGLPMIVRENLKEWNFGAGEGMSFEAISARYPDVAARFEDIEDFDAGWPEGETRRVFHRRVYNEFLDILRTYHDHTAILVAHGGVFGSLLAQIQGIHPNNWRAYDIRNCSVSHLEVTVNGTDIHLLNDVEHLNGLTDPVAGSSTQ